jgi:hypothetical protein
MIALTMIILIITVVRESICDHFKMESQLYTDLKIPDQTKIKYFYFSVNYPDINTELLTNPAAKLDIYVPDSFVSAGGSAKNALLTPIMNTTGTTGQTFQLERNSDITILDYQLVKLNLTSSYLEYGLYMDMAKNISYLEQYRLSVKHKSVESVLLPDPSNGTINLFSSSLQVCLVKESALYFTLIYERTSPPGDALQTVNLHFKVGVFSETSTQSNNFRRVFLKTITAPKDDFLSRLKKFQMIQMLVSEGNIRQFLIYEKGTPDMILVTSIGGLDRTSNLLSENFQMLFPVQKVTNIESEFFFFEQSITVPDINGTKIPTNMNYYLQYTLGQKITLQEFRSLKNLTRGILLDVYSNLENDLLLLDFLMPDLDGIPDETPVSSFYFSRFSNTFELYQEEMTANKGGKKYKNDKYWRFNTEDYTIELYEQDPDPNPFKVFISLGNRHNSVTVNFTAPRDSISDTPLLKAHLFRTESVLFLKYQNQSKLTQTVAAFHEFREPNVFFQYEPAPPPKTVPNRILQLDEKEKMNKIIITLKKPDLTNPLSQHLHDIRIVTEKNEYFEVMRNTDTIVETESELFYNKFHAEFKLKNDWENKVAPNGLVVGSETSSVLSGSFIESSVTFSGTPNSQADATANQDSQNLMRESYTVRVTSLEISQPILFSLNKNGAIKNTLIIDYLEKTSYFSETPNGFVFINDASDARNVSKVQFLDHEDALFNKSKNIFSLNVDTLEEKPMTGIGSYCKEVENIKIHGMPEFLLCLTEDSFQAHYTSQRFSAVQTKIIINQIDFSETLKRYSVQRMIYSNFFPNHIFLISERKVVTDTKKKVFFLHVFEMFCNMELFIVKASTKERDDSFTLELGEQDEIKYAQLHQNYLVIVDSTNRFLTYIVRPDPERKLTALLLNDAKLENHFKPFLVKEDGKRTKHTYELKILRLEHIKIFQSSSDGVDSSGFESKVVERLGFLLEINHKSRPEHDPNATPINQTQNYNVVIFDHRKESYDAFSPVFKTSACIKLFMGPMFIVQKEKWQRSLCFLCLEGDLRSKPSIKQAYNLKLQMLASVFNKIVFSQNISPEDVYSNPKFLLEKTKTQEISMQFFKTANWFVEQVADIKKNSLAKRLKLEKTISIKYMNTYSRFGRVTASLDRELLKFVLDSKTETWFGILMKKSPSAFSKEMQRYFRGHILYTDFKCESFIECRDNIINGTTTSQYSIRVANYFDMRKHGLLSVGFVNSNESLVKINGPYAVSRTAYRATHNKTEVRLSMQKLADNCSNFQYFEEYQIVYCNSEDSTTNYFRIFNVSKNMTWFDVPISTLSERLVSGTSLELRIKQNYIFLNTFNLFFEKYLTVLVFKIVNKTNIVNGERNLTKYFVNPLIPTFGLVLLTETPMNVDSVNYKVYNDLLLNSDPSEERMYLWGLTRSSKNSLTVKMEGYKIKWNETNGKRMYSSQKIADEKTLVIQFKLDDFPSSNYLLDNCRIICADKETKNLYDIIIHLPNAQDYLVRFPVDKLENTPNKTLNFTGIKFLVISNPFFGIRPKDFTRPSYFNSAYFVPSNYFPKKAYIRCYHLKLEERDLAEELKGPSPKLFDFVQKDEASFLADNSLPTKFTFGVLNYSTFIKSILTKNLLLSEGDYNVDSNDSNLV